MDGGIEDILHKLRELQMPRVGGGQSYIIHFVKYPWDEPLYILDLKDVCVTHF